MSAEQALALDVAVLLHEAPDAIVVVNRAARVVLANAAADRLLGAKAGELVGCQLDELVPQGARPGHAASFERYLAAPTTHLMGSGRALKARRRDGAEVAVEIALAPSRFDEAEVVVAVLRDRSAQVATEEARRHAEVRANHAHRQLDVSSDTIVRLDAAGRIVSVNDAWRRFAHDNGADASTLGGIGLDYLEVCRRDPDAQELARGLEELLAGKRTELEHRYRCNAPDRLRRFQLRAEAMRCDDACGCGGLVLVHRDVTELELATARLAVQREVAHALAAGTSVREVCRVLAEQVCERLEWDAWDLWGSVDGAPPRLLEVQRRPGVDVAPFLEASRAMSFAPGVGLVGRVWNSRRPEWAEAFGEDGAFPRAAVARACGLSSAFAVPLVSGDETFLVLSFFSRRRRVEVPASMELLMAIGAQIAEVSRRQRAEEAARLAAADAAADRERLRAMLDYAPGYVAELDREGVVRYVNRTQLRPREETIGRTWLQGVPEGDRARLASLLHAVVEGGAPATFELEVPMPDGSKRAFLTHLGPLRAVGAAGACEITGAILLSQDVTEKRQVQVELDAARRLATTGMLAAGVAHEINNPLSSVIANLGLLHQQLAATASAGSDVAELLAALDDARDGAERIRAVASDLRTLSRPSDEATSAVDTRRVFESSLRLANHETRLRARVLRSFDEVPPVRAAEGRLGQVLLNLLINAAQALPEGQVDRHEIRVATRRMPDGMVCLEVADTGPGIPDEIKRKLFTPFVTTKASGTGTGLGLVICDSIVRSFGGRIEVESALGRGTCFRVLLPPATTTPATTPPKPSAPVVVRRRVLIVDDEPVIGRAVARALVEHEVVAVTRAREALALFERGERFDLIMCDLMMPEMSGADFVAALRGCAPTQVERVVLITAGVATASLRRWLDETSLPVLPKPFTLEELQHRLAACAPATG